MVYLCEICKLVCNDFCVECSGCNEWIHFDCLKLNEQEIDLINSSSNKNPFYCPKCILSQSSLESVLLIFHNMLVKNHENLMKAAKMIKISFKNATFAKYVSDSYDYSNLPRDHNSNQILEYNNTIYHCALNSSADGNCFFNSLSISLYGNELHSTELRVKTLISMIINWDEIIKIIPSEVFKITSTIFESLEECSRNFGWSNCITIASAAYALNIEIQSIYPPMNGFLDFSFTSLNYIFNAQEVPKKRIYLMWTNTLSKKSINGRMWIPNHFVPVVPIIIPQENQILNIDSSNEENVKFKPQNIKNDVNENTSDDIKSLESLSTDHGNFIACSNNNISTIEDMKIDSSLGKALEIKGVEECLKPISSIYEIYDCFMQNEIILDIPPIEDKSNCQFFCDCSKNTERMSNNIELSFYDDIGSWDYNKSSYNTNYYIESLMKIIYRKNDLFYIRKQIDGKRGFEIIDPQPQSDEILIVKRYMLVSECNGFRRRVTLLISPKYRNFEKKAFYQYIGKQPKKYSRTKTKPQTMDYIKANIEKNSKEIYRKNDDIRNYKQIYNIRNRSKKTFNNSFTKTISDEILECIGKIGDGFVQQIMHTDNDLPPIICYYQKQLDFMRNFIQNYSIIIGVDRTFNLGSYFLTMLNFKNTKVILRTTNDNPIFFGPFLLHKKATYSIYHYFFSHISSKIKAPEIIDLNQNWEINLGSDSEKAIVKAIENVFPNSIHFLCIRHLEQNFNDFLNKSISIQTPIKKELKLMLFGADGLANSKDQADFEENEKRIYKFIENLSEASEKSYLYKLIKTIYRNVAYPNWKIDKKKLFTNNNAESLNHVIKRAVNWNVKGIRELIEIIEDLVSIQYLDLEKALYNEGNYKINNYEPITKSEYQCLSMKKKEKLFKDVYGFNENIFDEGKIFKIKAELATRARKPGSRKRPKSHRTR